MRAVKRTLCLTLALLLLAGLAPAPAGAAETVYFTAVNDQLLPLNDETMPFWSNGALYVAHTAFDGSDLGVFFSRNREMTTVVLYKSRRGAITFNYATGAVETNNGQTFTGAALLRGDVVFLPLDLICRFFGLEYSYTRISYGYLIRIKNENVVLSDATFIDAASSPMAQRYARYERAQMPEEDDEASPSSGGETARVETRRTVYFVIESTGAAYTEQALAYLTGGRAAYLFAPDALAASGDLLRRLAAGDGAVALRVNASADAADALAQIAEGNRALWTAANAKTRLVYLDGASEETARAVAEAGYCPLRFALDFSAGDASAARMSSRILSAADAAGDSCCVFLGTDETASAALSALIINLRGGNCTPARLNEAAIS